MSFLYYEIILYESSNLRGVQRRAFFAGAGLTKAERPLRDDEQHKCDYLHSSSVSVLGLSTMHICFVFLVFFKLHFVMFDCSATPKMGPLHHDSISEEESFVRKVICEESDQNKNKTKSTSCKQSRVAYCVNLERMTHPNKVHQPFFLFQCNCTLWSLLQIYTSTKKMKKFIPFRLKLNHNVLNVIIQRDPHVFYVLVGVLCKY